MLGSGSSVFANMDEYEVALPTDVNLLSTLSNHFRARLTWVGLPHLHLLYAQEAAPRLAFVKLSVRSITVIFPTQRTSPLICNGIRLELGDAMFHSRGERFHQRTTAACSWGAICVSPDVLRAYGRILTDEGITPPAFGQVLHLASGDRQRLLQLHARAVRIAETVSDTIAHREVARALDQDLIWALVTALQHGNPFADWGEGLRCHDVLNELEEALVGSADLMSVPDVCRALGISTRMLRACCSRVLGMSAGRYMLLHRLRQVCRALRHAKPEPKAIAEITYRYGFSEPRHFAAAYHRAFGETPWRRSPRS
jgi:AraC-like DNA-binding protein